MYDLTDKRILIAGGTGLIGSRLAETLLASDKTCSVAVMSRSRRRAEERFAATPGRSRLTIVEHDVCSPLDGDTRYDYIVNAASGADPRTYATAPVDVLMTNILGTRHLLDYGRSHGMLRFLYVSSGEVYGEPTPATPPAGFAETDSGYVDPNTPRACYPTAKRASEALCAAAAAQWGVDYVTVRPCHVYGPRPTATDSRAFAQFLAAAREGRDIVMRSPGSQLRSWLHVDDCASAVVCALLRGQSGSAYNLANPASEATIRQFAETLARLAGVSVRFELPGGATPPPAEVRGYTVITRAVFPAARLLALGWRPKYGLEEGLGRCIEERGL